VTGGVLAVALHDSDLAKENFLEFSCNVHHHIKRQPLWQLHLIEVRMMTMNMNILGITSQDLEEVPANWTTEVQHSDCAVIGILYNMSGRQTPWQ